MLHNIITPENVSSFAYQNGDLIQGPARGIVLEFHGLGYCAMMEEPGAFPRLLAQHRILYAFPYYGPWSWMNDVAVRTVDQIVSALQARYGLPADAPVVSTGGSMGGLSALIYCRYAARTPDACAANCPVCDLPYHFTERPDLPRTLYQAFGHYTGSLEEAMRSASPLHQAANLPDIPYYIVHGDGDEAVNKARHSDRLAAALQPAHRVTYDQVPGMAHCALEGAALARYQDFILSCFPG